MNENDSLVDDAVVLSPHARTVKNDGRNVRAMVAMTSTTVRRNIAE
jgi:hypothetical protein